MRIGILGKGMNDERGRVFLKRFLSLEERIGIVGMDVGGKKGPKGGKGD